MFSELKHLKLRSMFVYMSIPLHIYVYILLFFISNTFTSNAKLKLAKNPAKAKQHPVGKLSLFEIFLLSSSMLSSKTNLRCR